MSTVASAQLTVTSAGAKIIAAVPYGQTAKIANRDASNSFFVGPSGVTTSTGAEAKPNGDFGGWLEVPPETEIWAISQVAQTPRCDVLLVAAN